MLNQNSLFFFMDYKFKIQKYILFHNIMDIIWIILENK